MYEEARHEPLIEAEWNQELALEAIDRIVRETHARFDPQTLWPIHPLDKFSDSPTEPFRMLYFGAAGVIWALHYLNVVGATAMKRDFAASLIDLAAKNRAALHLAAPHTYSYLMGDVGIMLVQWRIAPSDILAEQIFHAVEANIGNPARELMWGAPGTMLAALFMFESSGDKRWREVYARSVTQLLSEWEKDRGSKLLPLDSGSIWALKRLPWSRAWFRGKCFRDHPGSQIFRPTNIVTRRVTSQGNSQTLRAERRCLRQLARRCGRQRETRSTLPRRARHDHLSCRPCRPAWMRNSINYWKRVANSYGEPGHSPKARTCVTAPPAMATPFSNSIAGPATRNGWSERAHSRCTPSIKASGTSESTDTGATRSGPATLALPCICGTV